MNQQLEFSDLQVGDIIECRPDNAYMGELEVAKVDHNSFEYWVTYGGKTFLVTCFNLTDYIMIKKKEQPLNNPLE